MELAQLRDPWVGSYAHPIIVDRSRTEEAHDKLNRLHVAAFRRWLKMGLQAQKADFAIFLSHLGLPFSKVVENWRALEVYRCIIPASASHAERELFASDLEMLLRSEQRPREPHQIPQSIARFEDATAAEIMTIKEVAEWLRVAARTLRQWAEEGTIPAYKMGRLWRFRRRDIENWLRLSAGHSEIEGIRHRRH